MIIEINDRGGNRRITFNYNGRPYMATISKELHAVIRMDRVEISWSMTRGTNEFTTQDKHYKSISMRSARAERLVAALKLLGEPS